MIIPERRAKSNVSSVSLRIIVVNSLEFHQRITRTGGGARAVVSNLLKSILSLRYLCMYAHIHTYKTHVRALTGFSSSLSHIDYVADKLNGVCSEKGEETVAALDNTYYLCEKIG